MSLVIYNTLSREKEPFAPIDAGHVRLYVCGPTVYDYVHIGNARPVVAFDVLYRLLKRRYPRVTYVRNITDIDDRIMVRAADNKREHRGADQRAPAMPTRATCAAWARSRPTSSRAPPQYVGRDDRHDRAADRQRPCLCRRRPCAVQRAEHERLRPPVAPHARRAGGGRPGRRGALQEGPRRLRAVEALDAAAAGLGQPVGPRPAGLAHRVLGDERQASGRDLRHPCRRSRPHLPAPRERDRAEPLRLRSCRHGEVLDAQRLPEHLGREDEQVARQLLHRARAAGPVSRRGDPPAAAVGALPPAARLHARGADCRPRRRSIAGTARCAARTCARSARAPCRNRSRTPCRDDLNTPLAISAIHQLGDPAELRAGANALGLLQQDAEAWFRWTPAGSSGPTDAEIEAAIAARQAARKAKDFKESDRIRDDLKAKGVILEDGPKGTTWKRG